MSKKIAIAAALAAASLTPASAQSPAPVITTQTIAPSADSFDRDGAYAADNFGLDPTLYVKNDVAGLNRDTYLLFSLPALPGEIHSATLGLYGYNNAVNNGGNYSGPASAYAVSSTSWIEGTGTIASPSTSGGITWNNQPALGSKLSSATITNASQYYNWNVISGLLGSVGGSPVSFAVTMDSAASDPDIFNSRQASSNPPKLTLTTYLDGSQPYSSLVRYTDGSYYGTTAAGGAFGSQGGLGVVYKMNTSGQVYIVHSFSGAEGIVPQAGLTIASDGNLYGGTGSTVYRLNSNGSVTVLHTFSNSDGADIEGNLLADSSGNLYGVTADGGVNGYGTIFKITTSGSFTLLHSFTGSDGAYPKAGLAFGTDGYLYGVTRGGGEAYGNDTAEQSGTIFKANPSTGALVWDILPTGQTGQNPNSPLVPDGHGNFYGTTIGGGVYNTVPGGDGGDYGGGMIYSVTQSGTLTKLKSFDNTDGQGPEGTIVLVNGTDIYGTTAAGTTAQGNSSPDYGPGVLYHYNIPSNTLTDLYQFTQSANGFTPIGGVTLSPDGTTLYGTTSASAIDYSGTVFSYSLSSGIFTTLHSFQPY